MIDRIKIIAEPVINTGYNGAIVIKWQIVVEGREVCVDTIVPRNDLIHSVFDYVWENAKRKLEIELDKTWPVKAIL